MSSEVQAKWMNSAALASSALSRTFSFRKYSIALTSWLVTASISFTRRASASEKFAAMSSSRVFAAGENGATSSMPLCVLSAWSQRTSTSTRSRMRPYSLKSARRAAVFFS